MDHESAVQDGSAILRNRDDLVLLEDSWGDVSEHRMSDGLTPEVVWVYLNGQCLAMATALATRFGGKVLVHTQEEESGEWDLEADEPVMYDRVVHVYAVSPDGRLWDVRGAVPQDSFVVEQGQKALVMTAAEARARFEGFLSEQNYEAARVFAPLVLQA